MKLRGSCPLLSLVVLLSSTALFAAERGVTEVECDFSLRGVELKCGYVEVPEDRAKPTGRRIPIHFVRARATGKHPQPDPVLVLGGGPGLHATRGARGVIQASREGLELRDLIVVDQRGTGSSNPLDCHEHEGGGADVIQSVFERDFFDASSYKTCRDKLSKYADLTQYTTTASVEDLEALRKALGYRTFNLRGGSYGTRWALEYIRRHPQSIRSAVLFGVAPTSELLVERVARDFENSLETLFDACEVDPACAKTYPQFRKQFHQVLERVRKQPVEVDVSVRGGQQRVQLGYGQLVASIRFSLYSVRMAAQLPQRVHKAVTAPAVL
jgi:pimeloyl-ACP methyl ester carboxylesterase